MPDSSMSPESGWFGSESQVGAVAYVDRWATAALLAGRQGNDILSGRLVLPDEALRLEPCELLWILSEST